MKHNMTFLKRCLALVLALVMVASSSNLGFALQAFAVDNSEKTVTVGELMANTYDQLTDAEKAFLKSGLLAGDYEVTYTVPSDEDGLVTINAEEKTVAVASYEDWKPVQVRIIADNEVVEVIDQIDDSGVVAYTYDGDAFTAEVDLELTEQVNEAHQLGMLNVPADLKAGLSNIAVLNRVDDQLATVEEAIPALGKVVTTAETYRIDVSEEFMAAVETLEAQMDDYSMLLLRVMNDGYEATVKYLLVNGADYVEALNETYEALSAIQNDELYDNSIIATTLQAQDPASYTQWVAFKGILADLMDALKPVYEDEWSILYTDALGSLTDEQAAQADTLLAGITEVTEVTEIVEDLFVAAATLRESRALVSVTVEVVLKTVENVADSAELVTYAKNTQILDFPENAKGSVVAAAVADKNVIESAVATWGDAYVASCFEESWSDVPATLTEDLTLTIEFTPKEYDVDLVTDGNTKNLGAFPYGYQMTLPSHEDAEKAYDYTIANDLYRQGMVYTILGPTTIECETVKAYEIDSLYAIIGSSFGNAGAQAVLNSGALKGDVQIYYRTPDVLEGDMLLQDNVLTVADSYVSGYNGLTWIPYTYGAKGNENTFSGNTAAWDGRSVNVRYVLYLNDQTAKTAQIAALTETLYADYQDQKAGMNSLLGKKADVEQLTGMYLSALKGIIRDFKFVDNVKKNQELRNYFIDIISAIQNDCVTDGSGYLDILAMINGYDANGMTYYYNNSVKIANEVEKLSSYLTDLVADEEKQAALAKLLQDPGVDRPELVDKIAGLGESLTTIKSQLIPTNDAIDLTSGKLPALIKALETEGGVSMDNYADGKAPYIQSDNILIQDDSAVVLKADVIVDGKKIATVNTDAYDKWTKLTASMIAELQALVDEELAVLGENAKYYDISANVADSLNQYLGQEMTDNLSVVATADAKVYTVKINGEQDQTITINDLNVNLPAYDDGSDVISIVYVYFIDGEELRTDLRNYEFTAEQLDTLFVNGSYTIERTERNEAEQKLAAALEKLNNNTAGNTYEVVDGTMYANISATGAGIQAFATGLLESGYMYIGMNGEGFMYENAEGVLEISIQTLVNALLNDNTFSNQTLIDLGNNNGGKVLETNLQLGMSVDHLYADKMGFVLSLNSVPGQMVTLSNALEAAKNNVSFHSENGIMVTSLNLPEKVYEVYLTALLAAGEIDTDDMNAVNNEIAFMFLYDYVELILGNEAITTETFQNTLNKLDAAANLVGKDLPNKDLTAYENAYQIIRDIYNSVDVAVAGEEPVTVTVNATASGLNQVIAALGIDLSAYETYLGMVKELNEKNEGIVLTATATAVLENTTKDFEALVIDLDAGVAGAEDAVDAVRNGGIVDEVKDNVKGEGLANSIDYTTDLIGRVSEVTGPAAIYLLSDVTGNLVINHTTILDLNGKTINGNITVKGGQLFIVDSKIATTDCGGVTGTISGDVNIVAGNYSADVTAYLKDGYKQVNGTVQNAMYTVEREGTEFTLVLNSDFMEDACVDGYLPSVRYLAAEIAIDMAMNFYIPANLTADGNRLYGIDDRFNDLIALAGMSAGELFDTTLECVDAEGIAAFANAIIDDMLQFGAIADAIENEENIASYTLETNPWAVEIMHAADGDYMTIGIVADDEVSRDVTLSLKIVGDNIKKLVALLRELDKIVVYEETGASITLKQPVRDGKTIVLEGGANASLSLDLTVHGEDQFDKDDYKNILAVIFAYGNPEKADALISAIGSDAEMNAAFNDMTVREIIKALDAMSRTTSFTEMASAVGAADLVSDSADDLEALYHLIACASGKVLAKLESMGVNGIVDSAENVAEKVLDKLELTTLQPVLDMAGNVVKRVLAKVDLDSKLGALDQGDGTYLLYYAYSGSGDVEYRGFGADLTLSETSGMLKVKIFEEEAEDCLWGDANHDNKVDGTDASLILQYELGIAPADFCTRRTDVNGDGKIDGTDASLVLQYELGAITLFPVEK